MKVCLLFATHNGEETLYATLDSIQNLTISRDFEAELVVVDNNSTDGTREILDAYSGPLPIRVLTEKKRGKNAALNTGIANIEADYVILTDDDVIFPADFILRWVRVFRRAPEYEIFGGAVVPRYERGRPSWLHEGLPPYIESVCFAKTLPQESGEVFPGMVFGNNMAVRREFFDRAMFDVNIGPGAGEYGMGSETEFNRRAHRDHGARAYFCVDLVVEHIITESQADPAWMDGRAIKFGRGQARTQIREGAMSSRTWFGAPRYLFSAWAVALSRSVLSLSAVDRLCWRWERFELLGRIREYRSNAARGRIT